MTDVDYMRQAIELARKGLGKTCPNPAVGCVIVKSGKIVGQGWHRKCGGPHAEILALRQAGEKALGATLYVTLEPCTHQGRTGPCVDQVIAGGVKRVVIAMKDPNPRVRGRSIQKMRWSGIEVVVGCLEDAAKELNQAFCKWVTTGMPLVTVKIAQTLDGKIATATGHSQWITSDASRKYTRRLRNTFDAILVGINTVLEDKPELNPMAISKPWTKIVLDSRLRIPHNAKVFKKFQTIVATTSQAPKARIRQLECKGVLVIICPMKNGRVSLKALLKQLGKREITNVLIEGGAKVIGSAFKEKVADRMITLIAPKIIGDQKALSSVDGVNILNLNRAINIDVQNVVEVGNDWIFEGSIKY